MLSLSLSGGERAPSGEGQISVMDDLDAARRRATVGEWCRLHTVLGRFLCRVHGIREGIQQVGA